MDELGQTLLAQATAYTTLEIVAVVCAVLYLVFAIRQNIVCWLFAGISTAIFVYVFVVARLYMESALNVFYFAMAIYGFLVWRRGTIESPLPVTTWPIRWHAAALAAIAGLSLLSGYLLDTRTDADYAYVDSATTWASIWATLLVARKVFENWWYWLVIDAVMLVVFWLKGLEFTALLYVVYLVLIPVGIVQWRRSMRLQLA
ncbi:MAG: nicotinamide riboside transporter PnuC [Pseudomonadota bacterium]